MSKQSTSARQQKSTNAQQSVPELLSALLNHPDTPVDVHNTLMDTLTSQRFDFKAPAHLAHILGLNEKAEPQSAPASEQNIDQGPVPNDFYVELPLTVRVLTGRDQRKISESERVMTEGVEYLFIVERLLWLAGQLGNIKNHDGWVFSENSLCEALESISEIGMAAADEASDRIQKLEHICIRLAEQQS